MGTENLSGPIGIAQMAGDTAQAGFLPFMYLMALLSISLAVINLLPIPVLDGGQLSLLALEAVRGKPLSEKVENIIYTGGAALVVIATMFMKNLKDLNWKDISEYLPAVIATLAMPLTYSISAGLALGFLSYALIKLLTG